MCPTPPTGTSPTVTSSSPQSARRRCASSPAVWPPASPACAATTAIPPRPDCRLGAIGTAYLEFACEEPGLFATAFALPQQHAYGAPDDGTGQERTPLGHLRTALDELVDAGVLDRRRRDGIEYPIWSAVHGLAVLTGQGPLRDVPDATRHHLEQLTLTFIDEGLA